MVNVFGCFLLTDSDVKREGKKSITEWYSRSPTKMNAVAASAKECKRLVHITDGHNALIFDNSLYTQHLLHPVMCVYVQHFL